MTQKYHFVIFFLFIFFQNIHAQPEPCMDPPMMTSFCEDACIICDIDGFTGRHESSIQGAGPADFCTLFQHNIQWIAFIAGSVDLEIELAVSNCDIGNGLEVAIYAGDDCNNFQMVSNCWGAQAAIGNNTSKTFMNTQPLVIGQYYYLVMDGAAGDNCDWTFTVINGNTQVSPLTTSGNIDGDDTVCPDLPIAYTLDFPSGATEFDWTVNGNPLSFNSDSIEFTFPNDGTYTLCVTARNACDEGPPTCELIEVQSVPDTDIVDVICQGDSVVIANTVIFQGGFYEFMLTNIDGCDSLVTLDLTELVTPQLSLDVDICDGDTLFIGTTPYTQTGIFQEVLTSVFDCDSIVTLDLFTIICNITSDDNPIAPICFGENSGMIEFNVVNGTAPFTYTWQELNNAFTGSGNISSAGEIVVIDNIPQGTYLITIEDTFGNSDIIISEVTQPPMMTLDFSPSDFNGVNVSCEDSNDGSLEVTASGGVPNYNYTWQTNQTTDLINNLTAGTYTVTITDQVGCTLVGDFELVAPTPLEIMADFNNPICDGPTTGFISITQSAGGIAPYTYRLNNNAFTSDDIFENLSEGNYELEMMDANGCVISINEILDAPQIPDVDLGGNVDINLGEPFTFNTAFNNVNLDQILWTPADDFDCVECLNPTLTPLNTGAYTLVVTSEDDCMDSDSITITVNKFRKFFAPNAFSPDFDGFNDFFTLYGGPEVEIIEELIIFNRWGAVVFEGKNMNSGIEPEGWDGTLNGKRVNPGVYAWIANIRFIDGEVISYTGDITVVK